MMALEYPSDAICVVGFGCVLPDAPSAEAFWKNLLAGHCSIREIPDARWQKNLYFRPHSTDTDFLRVATAAWIDDETLNAGGFPGRNRLHRLTLQAAAQTVEGLSLKNIDSKRIHVYLGCGDPDESYAAWKFQTRELPLVRTCLAGIPHVDAKSWAPALKRFSEAHPMSSQEAREAVFSSSVLERLRETFGWEGPAGLLDAACASSMVALDHSMRLLRSREADLIVSGGIEANLSPDAFAVFSVLGALAPERCLPFDLHSKGTSLGEGAVLFALERLEDALRLHHPIHGILKSCGASSDGRSASLFAPTSAGQKRAFSKAYADLDPRDLVFLECHGTGTRIGDKTELRSVSEHFARSDLPCGSVKALVGHTRGAAGAVGLLKCLLALRMRLIPPSPYLRDPLLPHLNVLVNTEPLSLPSTEKPMLMGISSFGFGGINEHLVLEEYRPATSSGKSSPASSPADPAPLSQPSSDSALLQVVRNVDRTFTWEELARLEHLDRFNIPPLTRPQIDIAQLGALSAVAEITREFGIDWSSVDPGRVSVIAAGNLALEAAIDFSMRLRYVELRELIPDLPAQGVQQLIALRDRLAKPTPDSSPGILNNVMAGRISHTYDFHGPSFSVDAGLNSIERAEGMTRQRLTRDPGIVIVVGLLEAMASDGIGLIRTGIRCLVFSSGGCALPCSAQVPGSRSGEMTVEPRPSEKPVVTGELGMNDNPLLKLVQRAIARVTGYEIERITVEDRLEEDLGIDSLKSAEIVVEVMKESGQTIDGGREIPHLEKVGSVLAMVEKNLMAGESPADLTESPATFVRTRFAWQPRALPPQASLKSGSDASPSPRVPLVVDLQQVLDLAVSPESCAATLCAPGPRPVLVVRCDRPGSAERIDFPDGMPGELVVRLQKIIIWFQALVRLCPEPAFDLFFLTSSHDGSSPEGLGNEAGVLGDGSPTWGMEASLGAFFACLGSEFPGLLYKHLHISRSLGWSIDERLSALVECERQARGESVVRYEGGKRSVLTLVSLPDVHVSSTPRVIVAFGGAKGITFALLDRMASQGMHLVIAGRSSADDATVAANLDSLRRTGAEVSYHVLDACDPGAVRHVLEETSRRHVQIDLVINGTGVERSRSLVRKPADEIHDELVGKLLPAMHIFAACRKVQPRLVVQFSSLVAHFPNPGQTVYACANAAIDALTERFNADPANPRAVAIDWPPWRGVGMTARAGIAESLQRRGISLLDPDQASDLFALELSAPSPGIVAFVAQRDVEAFISGNADREEPGREK